MFTEIATLTQAAGLSGVTMTMRPAPDNQLYVTVSFLLPPVTDQKVWDAADENAQRYIDLRAALTTPVVVTAKPDTILAAIVTKLAALSEPVTEAAKVYSETDISSMLKAASANAPKAAPKAENKATPAAKKKEEAPTSAKAESAPAPDPVEVDEDDAFSDFSEL